MSVDLQSAIDSGLFKFPPVRGKYNTRWWHNDFPEGHPERKENLRQAAMLCYMGKEALFGGRPGGGKSGYSLMRACQYLHVPGYAALILRREWPQLSKPGGLIPKSHEWLAKTPATWSEQKKCWTTPEGGKLQFGHCEHPYDAYNFQGDEYQLIVFEEICQFTEWIYGYICTRLRRAAGLTVPLEIRCTANPGGIGHDFVKQKFILSEDPNCIFLPSALDDNPFVDRESYQKQLDAITDPVLRKQMREGDWDIMASGGVLDGAWFETVIAADVPPPVMQVMACDVAGTLKRKDGRESDETVFMTGHRDKVSGIIYLTDGEGFRGTPGTVEDRMENAMDRAEAVCKTLTVEEKPPGEAGIERLERRLKRFAGHWYKMVPTGQKSKIERAQQLSTLAQAGKVKIVVDTAHCRWNAKFKSQCNVFGQPDVHDDWVDAAALLVNTLIANSRTATIVRSGSITGGSQIDALRNQSSRLLFRR